MAGANKEVDCQARCFVDDVERVRWLDKRSHCQDASVLSFTGTVTFQLRSAAGITDRAVKAKLVAIEAELGSKMSEVPDA